MNRLLALFLALSLSSYAAAPAYVVVGGKVTISVTCDGTAPFTYQWRKDGVDIPGATASTYVLAAVKPADAGNYTVRVSNAAGSTLSDTAPINVVVTPSNAKTAVVIESASSP